MLTFNLIGPDKREKFKKEIDLMFSLTRKEYGEGARDCFDHDHAHYLLGTHNKLGMIGGVRLIPISRQAMTTHALKNLETEERDGIWELSRVFFHVNLDFENDYDGKMFDHLCQAFYQGLYESLKTASVAKQINTFLTVFPFQEHQDVLHFGLWPLEEDASVNSPYDGNPENPYILGYMPMDDQTYYLFKDRLSSYESSRMLE
jgi:hypothetical protein